MSSEALWYLSRATGVASIVLFTAVLVLGMLTAARRATSRDAQTVVVAMHRWLALGSLVFLGMHIATAVLDGYVPISWYAALVPFTSAYEPLWVGLGALALDLLLAVVVTSLLRDRIGERAWRGVHCAAYAMWPLAMLHGLVMGTTQGWPLLALTGCSALVGAGAVAWRLGAQHTDTERRAAVLATGEWS